MTKINRLTQIPTLDDSDLAVVWQDSSERTRAITIANLRKFIQSTDPNADAFTQVALEGDELVFISHGEEETRVDINLLPNHSVTELKDMPDNLIAGQYIKVSEDGSRFVLTPASEIAAEIVVQQGDGPHADANVLQFSDGLSVAVENKIATIKTNILFEGLPVTKVYTESSINTLIEDDEVTISVNNAITPWPIHAVGIGDSPYVIDKPEQLGIEYQYSASDQFTQSMHLYHVGLPEGAQIKVTVFGATSKTKPIDVFQLGGGGDLQWPVSTPTVFTLRSGKWRVEESSQLLHVENATTFDDEAANKKVVHGLAIDPESSISMNVNEQGVLVVGGGNTPENPTFKSVNIDTAGSGNPNFAASIHQDGVLHTVIDATRELRVNYKDISTGDATTVVGIDNNQAQFLVPIMQGVDPVALKKEIPVIPDNGYIEKYSKADTDYVQIAYQGKYGDDRVYYPSTLRQDANGWFQFEYTGNLQFKPRDKSTDELGDTTLRIGLSRSDFYHPLYVEGNRVAERTTHHIYNTYSLNDLITNDDESFTQWMANNPDYTQVQFLNTLFSCTVLGAANWIASVTTSGDDYNGTFPNGYQQIEIHRNGGGSRSFLRAYNKESTTHYFANYKANTELDWKQYAYADDSVALKDKVSYDNEIQNLNTIGTGVFAEYLGYGSTSAEHTHTFDESGVFWMSNLQSSARNKIVNVVSSNGSELTGISVPFNRVVKFTYSSDIEEIITEASYANIDLESNSTFEEIDTSGFDSLPPEVKTLKKTFTSKDLISIPVELPDDMQIFVSSVICNVNGRLRKQPFEYQYENGILRVHLNEVCSGIIIAEMIK